MKKVFFILIAMLFAVSVNGQISYLQYRHVPADQDAKFLERETKHWSKVAESAIKKGQMKSWTLWRKIGITNADDLTPNYVFVNTFESLDKMDQEKLWSDNMDALGDVNPKIFKRIPLLPQHLIIIYNLKIILTESINTPL